MSLRLIANKPNLDYLEHADLEPRTNIRGSGRTCSLNAASRTIQNKNLVQNYIT